MTILGPVSNLKRQGNVKVQNKDKQTKPQKHQKSPNQPTNPQKCKPKEQMTQTSNRKPQTKPVPAASRLSQHDSQATHHLEPENMMRAL